MAERISCDIAILGGGLSGGLITLALAARRPELEVRLIEAGERLGGNHLWSFFDQDVRPEHRFLVEPLIGHRWDGYAVRFPAYARRFAMGYNSIESAALDSVLREKLPARAILTGRRVLRASATQVELTDGTVLQAGGVIDARGGEDLSALRIGYQKFLGQLLVLREPHGETQPLIMDATVEQADGYRFVYCLPFGPDRMFVEDTYYSEQPKLDLPLLGERIAAYARSRGWTVAAVEREETGVLPVAMGGDFARYWASGGYGVAKAGVRAGLFHPTTGYSLPDAVRLAIAIAEARDLSGAAVERLTHDMARRRWKRGRFYHLIDRMLFRGAAPAERYRILERFYRLSPALIGRFYAGDTSVIDKTRILCGKPPMPIGRAVAALLETGA